ncbi:serine/threonine-protein phosphatase catalytic subunit [Acrasis kona]|uniref:Serine/threonine-protein phosphatase n=1 Tax=Acrasis kona TaxID=1008807 RepID=A0AAW2ZJ76_9EUKA
MSTPGESPSQQIIPGSKEDKTDYTQRAIKEVSAPVWNYIPREQLFDADGLPHIDNLRKHLLKEGRVDPKDAIDIIQQASNILRDEPNLLQLQDPITVCGDIHGQYYDLVKLFEIGGEPGDTKYLFLGDYVDRGYFGTEVCFLLLSYKIRFPESFFMIRGNHECRHLTAYFNFKQECQYKYNLDIYDAFMSCFDCLPLGALLNGRFLCVHGGLSPEVKTLDDINDIVRYREPPSSGAMCDLLWSDPMDDEEEDGGNETQYQHNDLRGCSYVFSYTAANNFLKANNLLSVIRAHEAQDEGYRLYKKGNQTGFPTVICIFSAPNYCDVYNNKGAIIRFQNNLMNIRQFNCSTHPYYLPNFMNAFNWSLPFVVEKMMDMFQVILNIADGDEDSDDEDMLPEEKEKPLIDKERADIIKSKIRAVARLSRMYTTLREEHETIVMLKGLAGGQLPQGLLTQGPHAIQKAVLDFNTARKLDLANEKLPPGPPPAVQSEIKTLKRTDSEIKRDLNKPLTKPTIQIDSDK